SARTEFLRARSHPPRANGGWAAGLTAGGKARQARDGARAARGRLPGHLNDDTSREEIVSRRPLFGGCARCAPSGTPRSVPGGGAAAWPGGRSGAAEIRRKTRPPRTEVHHNIPPPTGLDGVKKPKLDTPPLSNWSVQKSLDDMDKAGIATAMTSPTTPQVNFLANDKEAAARIARESNEYTKKLMSDHPGRFGLFAMLPLPHIDASLKELAD